MPGLILCGRRWACASDDVFIPAIILFMFHLFGAMALIVVISQVNYDTDVLCSVSFYEYLVFYLIVLLMMLILEILALFVSCRGSISDQQPRKFLQHIIYSRLVLVLVELGFIVWGSIYLARYKNDCIEKWYDKIMKQSLITIVVSASVVMLILLLSISCVYDRAGKNFHRLKMLELSYKMQPHKINESLRQLRHREAFKYYNENWMLRFKCLCCLIKPGGDQKNGSQFSDIAETLSCLFYKYDVVPSDLIAGLLLLRDKQKHSQSLILASQSNIQNGCFDYLSGVPVTKETQFFNLSVKENLNLFKDLIYYYDYAAASYGWPFYLYRSRLACFKLMPNCTKNCLFSCNKMLCGCFRKSRRSSVSTSQADLEYGGGGGGDDDREFIENDNCCLCYYDAVTRQLPKLSRQEEEEFYDEVFKFEESDYPKRKHIKIIYANFSSDIGKPCYFVALDFLKRKIVITIRGTESLRDSITDMQWRAMQMPGTDPALEWYGHEGIVKSAVYIKEQLESKRTIQRALCYDLKKRTDKFDILVVGHSMGAGAATVLAIMLRDEYPTVKCYSYSPPGGLLSEACMEATKDLITSVILGKDMVPRLGIAQLEKLRNGIMENIRYTTKPKWQILSTLCCCKCATASTTTGFKDVESSSWDNKTKPGGGLSSGSQKKKASAAVLSSSSGELKIVTSNETLAATAGAAAPSNTVILESPLPQLKTVIDAPKLYPPGRILHIVRKYPRRQRVHTPEEAIDTIAAATAATSSSIVESTTNIAKSTSTINIYNTRVKTRATMTTIDDEQPQPPPPLSKSPIAAAEDGRSGAKKTTLKFDPKKRLQRLISSRLGSTNSNTSSNSSSSSSQIATAATAPVYQVIENDNRKFNELLISPRMLQDHMPNNLIKCMKAVLDEPAPKKPPRRSPSYDEFTGNPPNHPTSPSKSNSSKMKRAKSSDKKATAAVILVKETKASHHRHHVLLENIRKVPIIKRYMSQKRQQRTNQDSADRPLEQQNKLTSHLTHPQTTSMASFEEREKEEATSSSSANIANPRVIVMSSNSKKSSLLSNAPLAKPESLSDLLNQLDDLESIDNNSQVVKSLSSLASSHLVVKNNVTANRCSRQHLMTQSSSAAKKITNSSSTTFMSSNKSSSTTNSNTNELYYYDDSINLKGPISSSRLYGGGGGDAKSIEENEMTVGELNALIQKLTNNYSSCSVSAAAAAATSTSTPRYYLSSTNPLSDSGQKRSRKQLPGQLEDNQSICFMTDEESPCGSGREGDDDDIMVMPAESSSSFFTSSFKSINNNNNKKTINNNKYIVPEIQIEVEEEAAGAGQQVNQYSTGTESEHDDDEEDDLLFNQTSVSIVSSATSAGGGKTTQQVAAHDVMNEKENKSSSNRDSKNSDESNYIYGGDGGNNNNNNNQNLMNNMNTLLPSSNTNESIMTNYLAIEKLLKPHTNDYILCFDTSSIINDQNSSINSTSDMMRFMMLDDEELLSASQSHQIDIMNNSPSDDDDDDENSDLVEKCDDDFLVESVPEQHFYYDDDEHVLNEDKKQESEMSKSQAPSTPPPTPSSQPTPSQPPPLVVDYPDSGIDTARTLSPQTFSK